MKFDDFGVICHNRHIGNDHADHCSKFEKKMFCTFVVMINFIS